MTITQVISVLSDKFPQEDNSLGARCDRNEGPLGELQVVLDDHRIESR